MSLKDIKIRMNAIKKTATITQAMHNIALSKLKKSTALSNHTHDFSNKIFDVLKYANENSDYPSQFIMPIEKPNKLYVLITADRGLCGSYHNQLYKAFLEETKDLDPKEYQVLVIGKKGYFYAKKHELSLINPEVIYHRDDLAIMSIREYAEIIKKSFEEDLVDELIVMHNHYQSASSQTVNKQSVLPIIFGDEKVKSDYIYDVSPETVMDKTIGIYIESKIFEALADAKLSEHAARMVAMKSATDNANQIVDKLHMQYHRARQQEITSELIDVVNGSSV